MIMEYTVLDENGEASGSLEMRICNTPLSKIMNVDWMPGGLQFFQKQLPTSNIYPIAVLDWVETKFKKQNRGIGLNAIRAFRMIAEEHKARLGLLRVGTGGAVDEDDDLESALKWRQRFYERDSWIRLENPPVIGLVVFWMYNLLPPIQPTERVLRTRLAEKPPTDPLFGLPQPTPI
jgi:hypothetical protein